MADDEPGPKPGLVPPQPSSGTDDHGLRVWCETAGGKIREGMCSNRIEGRVDLSDNNITDAGLKTFVDFLIEHKVTGITSLSVDNNQLRKPTAIVELLRDIYVGLSAGNLRQVRLAEKEMGCEVLWRVCETCCKIRDRHHRRFPLELVIVSREASCGEDVMRVLRSAEENGLKLSGYGFSDKEEGSDVTVSVVSARPGQQQHLPRPDVHAPVDDK